MRACISALAAPSFGSALAAPSVQYHSLLQLPEHVVLHRLRDVGQLFFVVLCHRSEYLWVFNLAPFLALFVWVRLTRQPF